MIDFSLAQKLYLYKVMPRHDWNCRQFNSVRVIAYYISFFKTDLLQITNVDAGQDKMTKLDKKKSGLYTHVDFWKTNNMSHDMLSERYQLGFLICCVNN